MQEPAEPNAFAPAFKADAVHAVVPVACSHERQSVTSHREAPVERPRAMLKESRFFRRRIRLEIGILFSGGDRLAFKKRNGLIQNAGIAGDFQIMRDDIRQPQEVIRNVRAHAAARRRVPPMLHVAFSKLPAGGAENVLARQIPTRNHQRHHVL